MLFFIDILPATVDRPSPNILNQEIMKREQYPQVGHGYGITHEAAMSSQSKSNVEVIAA